MQVTRYLSLNENQFLGCLSAFVDTLDGELNSALTFLRRLEGTRKGSAFAFEMQMDRHRYGALIVLERWGDFTRAFAGHVELGSRQAMFDEAAQRVSATQNILQRANQVVDDAPFYTTEIVEACALAYRTVEMTFAEERKTSEQTLSLGPMLAEDFKEYRRVFVGDLAER